MIIKNSCCYSRQNIPEESQDTPGKMKSSLLLVTCCLPLCLHALFWRHKRTAECSVALPQETSRSCQLKRQVELRRQKMFYKISSCDDEFPVPHLDQPMKNALKFFMTDEFHSHWFNIYFNVFSKNLRNLVGPAIQLKYKNARFTSYQNYTEIPKVFKDYILKAVHPLTYFKYPSMNYEYFTDLTEKEIFRSDRYFAEERLAGLNPMAIRRVDLEGNQGTKWRELKERLELTDFNWENAIKEITGENLFSSIGKHKVYVVEYPILDGIPTARDILAKERPLKRMYETTCPIALLAVDARQQLKVVGIQNDTEEGSQVYTPKDGIMWNITKAQFQANDGFVGQIFEHLLRTHLRMEPVCIALYRHLSKHHPIHQIMKYHCRGLIPLNARGHVTLLVEPQTVKSLFPHGNKGAIQMLQKGFQAMTWNDIDIERNVWERGMDDDKQIPFFPYRDDGKLINDVLEDFAHNLINLYYRSDLRVRRDFELQKFVNELSANGNEAPDGGKGRVRGLPPFFRTKHELADFVKESLWIVVQHSVYSFPIVEHGSTPAVFPTKLYKGHDAEYIDMLPGPISAVLQGSLAHGLGSLHYDSFFDYYDKLSDIKLRNLVRSAYSKMGEVQGMIHGRNKKRYESGYLTNPFMLRDWMPNSIST